MASTHQSLMDLYASFKIWAVQSAQYTKVMIFNINPSAAWAGSTSYLHKTPRTVESLRLAGSQSARTLNEIHAPTPINHYYKVVGPFQVYRGLHSRGKG